VVYDPYDERKDWDNLVDDGLPYAFGVQAIVQDHHEVGVEIVYGKQYFIWRYNMWQCVDYPSFIDYLAHTDRAHVLFGRLMPREDWNALYRSVEEYKHGWLPGENWEE
jgi:hypothetical protein